MAEHAGADRHRKHREHRREGHVAVRQQHVEHGGGAGDIHRGRDQLGDDVAQIRQCHGTAEHRHRAAPHSGKQQHRRNAGQHQKADAAHRRTGHADQRGEIRAGNGQPHAGHEGKAETEGGGHVGDHLGNGLRLQAEGRIEAVADRATGQRAEAGYVADGVGAEAGQRHQPVGQPRPGEMQRMHVIDGKRQETAAGEQQGKADPRPRGVLDGRDKVVVDHIRQKARQRQNRQPNDKKRNHGDNDRLQPCQTAGLDGRSLGRLRWYCSEHGQPGKVEAGRAPFCGRLMLCDCVNPTAN